MTTPTTIGRPGPTEAAEYYGKYIDQVRSGDIRDLLASQLDEVLPLLQGISEEQSLHRYAPEKWSIREVLSHVNDGERLFAFRAFWFSRGFDTPLPSFDQDVAAAAIPAHDRSWASLVDEFRALRASTVPLFAHLPAAAWDRRGVASGNPVTVRALAYITAGHVAHHATILRERYLAQATAE